MRHRYSLLSLSAAAAVLIGAGSSAAAPSNTKPQPDLTVDGPWLTQSNGSPHVTSVVLGQPFTACFVVHNIGAAPSGGFQAAADAPGISPSPSRNMSSLAAGASGQTCVGFPTTPGTVAGTYTITARANALSAVAESNETNNTTTFPVLVAAPAAPDLTIQNVWLSPTSSPNTHLPSLSSGQAFSLCFIVANTGNASAGAFMAMASGTGWATLTTPSQAALAQGATRQLCLAFTTTPAAGTRPLTVTVDAGQQVAESHETNNESMMFVSIH